MRMRMLAVVLFVLTGSLWLNGSCRAGDLSVTAGNEHVAIPRNLPPRRLMVRQWYTEWPSH